MTLWRNKCQHWLYLFIFRTSKQWGMVFFPLLAMRGSPCIIKHPLSCSMVSQAKAEVVASQLASHPHPTFKIFSPTASILCDDDHIQLACSFSVLVAFSSVRWGHRLCLSVLILCHLQKHVPVAWAGCPEMSGLSNGKYPKKWLGRNNIPQQEWIQTFILNQVPRVSK